MGFCGGHQLAVGLGMGFDVGLWVVAVGDGWFGLIFCICGGFVGMG